MVSCWHHRDADDGADRYGVRMVLVLTALAVLVSGLGAGIFLAYSVGVVHGLARAGDEVFVAGMRGINVAVLNPAFLGAIFLGPLLAAGAAVAAFLSGDDAAWWATASAVVGFLGIFVVTGAKNVPMNTRLETSREPASVARREFERPWLAWNHVRTVASLAAFGLAVVALMSAGGS